MDEKVRLDTENVGDWVEYALREILMSGCELSVIVVKMELEQFSVPFMREIAGPFSVVVALIITEVRYNVPVEEIRMYGVDELNA